MVFKCTERLHFATVNTHPIEMSDLKQLSPFFGESKNLPLGLCVFTIVEELGRDMPEVQPAAFHLEFIVFLDWLEVDRQRKRERDF